MSTPLSHGRPEWSASQIADSGTATETYLVTQISLEASNGSNTLSIAPNGSNPLPIPLILVAGGPAPWQTAFTVNAAQTTTVTATFRFDPAVTTPHQFDPYIDPYGQAISAAWPAKISSDSDLQAAITQEQVWLAANGPLGGMDKFGGSTEGCEKREHAAALFELGLCGRRQVRRSIPVFLP